MGRTARTKENMMAKYLLLKHYRGAPAAVNDVPMDQWTPEELSAHVQYMKDFAARLEGTGEFVDEQALSPEGTFVRYDGEGRPPVTDGPFAETKDLIAGWMVIDVETYEQALELVGELSAAPGAGGKPIHEWLEARPAEASDQPAAVAHQLAVGQLVHLAPGLDAARGDAQPAVRRGQRTRVEAGARGEPVTPLLRQRVDLEDLDLALDHGHVARVAQRQP